MGSACPLGPRVGTLVAELPEGRSEGTAFLVGDSGILTTFHTIFGRWYVTALRPPSHENAAIFTLTEAAQWMRNG